MSKIALIHPATLDGRNSSAADAFELGDVTYRIVRSESIPVGEVWIDLDGGMERRLKIEEVTN